MSPRNRDFVSFFNNRDPIRCLAVPRVMFFLSTPPDQALNAPRIANWISSRLIASPARREPSPLLLGPRNDPRRVRGELLDLLVPSFQKMVLGVDLSASSGEALQWRRREGCSGQPPAPAPLPLSPKSDLRRSIAILRSKKKDTPSPDGFVKETLGNFMFRPAVRGDFRRRRFAGLKTYFRRFK